MQLKRAWKPPAFSSGGFFCVKIASESKQMIELRQINKTYHTKKGSVTALADINLTVQRGEIFSVIGKSGAGKSTLIRCVNLLEKPSSGVVIVDNQDLTKLSSPQLRLARHHIGMFFQHFNLLNTRTVYQNVAFPLQLLKTKRSEIKKTVLSLLELTGLSDKTNAYPSQLSGGQKQRVAIARALATKPNVLLCDEMTSSLDPETTASILRLIKNINQQLNLSILLITHEMDVIKTIADRVAVLDHGEIVEQDDVVSIFKNPHTAVAKRLTQSSVRTELPASLQSKIRAEPVDHGYALIRIAFVGKVATEPMMEDLIKHFNLRINILQANLEFIHNETIGVMLVAANADQEEIEQGVDYLKLKGIGVEVLGYVTADDWLNH